jgi:hypothetical protein
MIFHAPCGARQVRPTLCVPLSRSSGQSSTFHVQIHAANRARAELFAVWLGSSMKVANLGGWVEHCPSVILGVRARARARQRGGGRALSRASTT